MRHPAASILPLLALLIGGSARAEDPAEKPVDHIAVDYREYYAGSDGHGMGFQLDGKFDPIQISGDGVTGKLAPEIKAMVAGNPDAGRIDRWEASVGIGSVDASWGGAGGNQPNDLVLVSGKAQYVHDERSVTTLVGPELSIMHTILTVGTPAAYGCLVLPFFAPNEYGIGKFGPNQTSFGGYAQWSAEACGHFDLGSDVGQIDLHGGAQVGTSIGDQATAFSGVYANAGMKHIAGTALEASVGMNGTRIYGAGDGPSLDVAETYFTVGAAY